VKSLEEPFCGQYGMKKNYIFFQNKACRTIRSIGNSIIILSKQWYKLREEQYSDNLHLILPHDINLLSVQMTVHNLISMPLEEWVLFG
jgi:hypothetical protein